MWSLVRTNGSASSPPTRATGDVDLAQARDRDRMAAFVQTRDRQIYETLFQKYKQDVHRHVRRFVKSEARAEELTQDVFVRVYTTKKYEAKASFRTWLFRVATNVCLSELRKPEQKQEYEDVDKEGPPLAVSETTPECEVVKMELAMRIEAALLNLPPKQRAAFLMARQDGLSQESIASALCTSVSAVKSLIHRALDTLRAAAEEAQGETV